MGVTCGVCNHPNRMDIDAALLGLGDTGRLSQRQICERYGLGRGQVSRHVQNGHIAAIMTAVDQEVTALHGQGLLTELASLYERANRLLSQAEHAEDTKVAIAAIRECRGVIETFARIGLAMSQGEDPDAGTDRPDLDAKIDEALRRREKRLALAETTPPDPDDEVIEAEVVE